MPRSRTRTALAVVLALIVVVAVVVAVWWLVEREQVTTSTGTCDGQRYELEAETEDGVVDVSFELTTSGPGEAWGVVLRRGTTVVAEGDRLSDEDAEVSLDAQVPADGEQTYTAEATPAEGGQPCVAEVTHG